MTAFKRYAKSKGFIFNEDFHFLPHTGLQYVECDAKSATITYYYLTIVTVVKIKRNGEVKCSYK